MVDHLVAAVELRVLVRDRVEAVRARRHDRFAARSGSASRCCPSRASGRRIRCPSGGPDRRCTTPPGRGWRSARRPRSGTSRRRGPRAGSGRRTRPRSPPSTGPRSRPAGPRRQAPRPSGTGNGRPFVQSVRVERGWPHGFWACSMLRNATVSSDGNRDSSSTRLRRKPTILSTCSIRTGHASTHAPHVTQSQTASYGIASSTIGFARSAGRIVSSRPYVSRTIGEFGMRFRPCSASALMSRIPMMNVLGLSGLPVFQAGHASWQRPHSVQVNPSSRSFQPRSWSVLQTERHVLALEVHRRQLRRAARACAK